MAERQRNVGGRPYAKVPEKKKRKAKCFYREGGSSRVSLGSTHKPDGERNKEESTIRTLRKSFMESRVERRTANEEHHPRKVGGISITMSKER